MRKLLPNLFSEPNMKRQEFKCGEEPRAIITQYLRTKCREQSFVPASEILAKERLGSTCAQRLTLFALILSLTSGSLLAFDFTISHQLDCDGNTAAASACVSSEPAFQTNGILASGGEDSTVSAWWAWTPPETGWATICGRSVSAPLVIRIHTESGDLLTTTDVPSNDPSAVGVAFTSSPETTWWIELTADTNESTEFDLTVALRPLNDDFQRRLTLTLDSDQTHAGHNFFATEEPGEPNHNEGVGNRHPAHNTVWWSFTAPDDVEAVAIETVDFQFDSDREPGFAVYRSEDHPTAASLVASNFGGVRNPFVFRVKSGEEYNIGVDGLKPHNNLDALSAFGEFSFVIRPSNPIENDSFLSPRELIPSAGPIVASAREATEDLDGDPSIGDGGGRSSLWWFWDAPKYELEVIEDLGSIESDLQEHGKVLIAIGAHPRVVLRIIDDQGQEWEVASDLPTLRPHQLMGFEEMRNLLPLVNGGLDGATDLVSDLKSLAADILGFRRCISVHAKGVDAENQPVEVNFGIFAGLVSSSSVPLATGSDELNQCIDLDGQRYLIGIENKYWENPEEYQIELDWADSRPVNDDFAWANPLETATLATGNNRTASEDSGDPVHSNLLASNSIWWWWTSHEEGNYRLEAETNDFPDDLLVSVYQNNGSDELEQVSRNFQIASPSPDRSYPAMSSYTTFRANADTVYFILIQGYDGGHGDVQLYLESYPSPGNDEIANAFLIDSNLIQGNNESATSETNEPNHGNAFPGQTLWWTWVAPNNGQVVVQDASALQLDSETPATVFAVYQCPDILSEDPFENLTFITSNHVDRTDYSDQASFIIERNARYYLAVNTRDGMTGDISLIWNLVDGYILENANLSNDRFTFEVTIAPQTAPLFQIFHSMDLQTWERLIPISEVVNGKATVELNTSEYGPQHFFRVVETITP